MTIAKQITRLETLVKLGERDMAQREFDIALRCATGARTINALKHTAKRLGLAGTVFFL